MTPKRCAAIHASCFDAPRPWSKAEFIGLLDSPHVFLCCEENGFALGRVAGPEAELLTIAVEPDAQGTGQGRALLQQFEQQAQSRGAEEYFLEVSADNSTAIALYTQTGYAQTGIRKDYYESPKGARISALVLKKIR